MPTTLPARNQGAHSTRPRHAAPTMGQEVATVARAVGATIAAVTLIMLAFLWPTYTSKAHHLPVGVAAPAQMQPQVQQRLAASGTFDVRRASSRDDLVRQIRHRDVYGGFVVNPQTHSVELLTAPAASPVAAQALQAAGQAMGAQAKMQVKVTEVVPLSSHDTRGAGLAILSLPLAMGGMVGGIMISLLVHGFRRRLPALVGYGAFGGLVLILILHSWMHVLQGSFWLEVLAMGLALFATASVITGLKHLLGNPGMALGAIITMFLGNPLSSMSMPSEMLPWHWGTIGQFLVPGAAGTLLRLESYFPDASTTRPWLVLCGWSLLGVALMAVAHHQKPQAPPRG